MWSSATGYKWLKKKNEGRSGRKRRNKGQKNVDVNEKEKRFNREG